MCAKRVLVIGIAAAAALAGCGGGGGHEAKVVSEALVSDGPAGCVIQADVDTGPDLHDTDGVCLPSVAFHLFDGTGNELSVQEGLGFLRPDERVSLRQRICRGQVEPFIPAGLDVGDVPSAPSLFLVADADACPAGFTARGDLGLELHLARPLQEISCQEIGRLEVQVDGCG
jgi:hypothetical protein